MSTEKKSHERKTERPVKEAAISAILTMIAAIVGVLADLVASSAAISELFGKSYLIGEYAGFIVIVLLLIGVAYVLTRVAITYYQRKTLQTATAIKKLREKEVQFFQKLETDLSSLLTEKVR
jgi:uncharacterized membrane protein